MAEDRAEIDHLVAYGADPNAQDAAYNNPVGEVAAALFEVGADPGACDGYGQKPLSCAFNTISAALIDAVLDAGTDPADNGETIRDAPVQFCSAIDMHPPPFHSRPERHRLNGPLFPPNSYTIEESHD